MKVSHLCVNYGTPLFHELFQSLSGHGIEQNVFYPRNIKNRKINSLDQYQVDSPLVLNLLTKISFQRKRQIMKEQYTPLFQVNNPDLIHAHTLFSDGSLAYHCHKKYGTPYIVAVRASDIDIFLKFKPWLKVYGKRILDHSKFIIFISPSLQRKFQRIYGRQFESKTLIISNGISKIFFSGNIIPSNKIHTPLKLLYVGRFLRRKGVPALIRFVSSYPAVLTIVGEGGNQEKTVLQMIQKSSKVHFLGLVKDTDKLISIYQNSDIFIMLSRRETLGLVYIEAMSQGIPVIYFKGTGIDGLFRDGEVGVCIDSRSSDEIGLAIQRIVSDYQTMSNNCIEMAKDFNWSKISKKYYQLYTKSLT